MRRTTARSPISRCAAHWPTPFRTGQPRRPRANPGGDTSPGDEHHAARDTRAGGVQPGRYGVEAGWLRPGPVGHRGGSTYYNEVTDNPNAAVNMRSYSWCSDWPSRSDWFPQMFATASIPKDTHKFGFGCTISFFSPQAVDCRINAIPRLLLAEQKPAWNALDKSIQTKYFPVIVTSYFGAAMMRGSKVHNDLNDPTSGAPTWKDLWLG